MTQLSNVRGAIVLLYFSPSKIYQATHFVEKAFAGVPKSFLGEDGVRNSDCAVQRIVDERRRANFLHLTPSKTVDRTWQARKKESKAYH